MQEKYHKPTILTGLKLFVAVILFSFGSYALNVLWEPIVFGLGAVLGTSSEEFRWSATFWVGLGAGVISYGALAAVATYWLSDFTRKSVARSDSQSTITAETQETETTQEETSAEDNQKKPGGWSILFSYFSGSIGVGAVFFLLGALLLVGGSDARVSVGVLLWGLSGILVSYAAWSVIDSMDVRKKPFEFARQICKAFCVVLAVLGLALILQGIGDLMGWYELGLVGSTLAELSGGS